MVTSPWQKGMMRVHQWKLNPCQKGDEEHGVPLAEGAEETEPFAKKGEENDDPLAKGVEPLGRGSLVLKIPWTKGLKSSLMVRMETPWQKGLQRWQKRSLLRLLLSPCQKGRHLNHWLNPCQKGARNMQIWTLGKREQHQQPAPSHKGLAAQGLEVIQHQCEVEAQD